MRGAIPQTTRILGRVPAMSIIIFFSVSMYGWMNCLSFGEYSDCRVCFFSLNWSSKAFSLKDIL